MSHPQARHWPYPTLIAHRGGGLHAPENTLAAVRTGREAGFHCVEFDVKLSRDNVALLMHDDTLERTTHGNGAVALHTMAALEQVNANKGHEATFPGEPVPRFTAVAKLLHGLGLTANIEIKPCPGRDTETGRLVTELTREIWRDRLVKPLLSSFSAQALLAARAVSADLPIGVLCEQPTETHWELANRLGAVALHCDHHYASADLVIAAHQRGLRLLLWTVNDTERAAALLRLGVDGLFTDSLSDMAKAFPAQLADTGKPMCDPIADMQLDWTGTLQVIPPV
jgi:glycerophosphoryl diester phosphodiesterase